VNSDESYLHNWQRPISFSENLKRDSQYISFLNTHHNKTIIVSDIIDFGYRVMRKAKLHHHFFGKSLLKTAQYLTFSYLQFPYEYQNLDYLYSSISLLSAKEIIILFERIISERMPVEYITHEAWYLGNKFYVNENVLVPRSCMNTRFNDFLNQIHWKNNQVLDLCTGSGCIGITLALLNSQINIDLIDVSPEALEVATINVNNYHMKDRIRCVQSDLFENVQNKYDLIITNPPYVSTSEYKASPVEFKKEPKIALEAGLDGLDIIKRIISEAKDYLNKDGKLIAEVGTSAAKLIKRTYPKIPFKWFKYRKPAGGGSKFDNWVDRVFGMDCIFMCEAKDLSSIN
jgi:ribosomal protein L3 glutamine methyltransferase